MKFISLFAVSLEALEDLKFADYALQLSLGSFSFVILFHKSRLISSIDQNHGACPTNSETCSYQSSVQRGGVSPRIGKVIT